MKKEDLAGVLRRRPIIVNLPPDHPHAHVEFGIETMSRFSGWLHTGALYQTMVEAEAAKRALEDVGSRVRIVPVRNLALEET